MEEEPSRKRRNTSNSRGIARRDDEKDNSNRTQHEAKQPEQPESVNSTFCAIVSTYIGSSNNDDYDDNDERASTSCQNKQWWVNEWNKAIMENRLDPNVFCMYGLQRHDDEPKQSSSDDEHDDDSSTIMMDCCFQTTQKGDDETKHSTATAVVEAENFKKRRTAIISLKQENTSTITLPPPSKTATAATTLPYSSSLSFDKKCTNNYARAARAGQRRASLKNIKETEKIIPTTTTEMSSADATNNHNFLWTGVFKNIETFSELISRPHNRQVLENWLWKFRSSSSSTSTNQFPMNISLWQRVNGVYNNRAMIQNNKQGTGTIIMIREHSFDTPSSYRMGIQMLCQLASTSLLKEQYCTSYDILTSCDVLNRPHDVLEFASWSSHDAYVAHVQTDYYQIALTKLKSLCSLNNKQQKSLAPAVLWIRSDNGLYHDQQQTSSSPPELASLRPMQATAAAMTTSATATTTTFCANK